jgi:hypothetical protein
VLFYIILLFDSVVHVIACWVLLPCFTHYFITYRWTFVVFIMSLSAACFLMLLCCYCRFCRCCSTIHIVHVVALFTFTCFSLLSCMLLFLPTRVALVFPYFCIFYCRLYCSLWYRGCPVVDVAVLVSASLLCACLLSVLQTESMKSTC